MIHELKEEIDKNKASMQAEIKHLTDENLRKDKEIYRISDILADLTIRNDRMKSDIEGLKLRPSFKELDDLK